ncbi:MAG TPA: exosome complex exonuclease Rrp41 [Thermoplasmata archaeon]|nr:exosome complex exonuclease Rrp41 [Thermoplasmata archaeon]
MDLEVDDIVFIDDGGRRLDGRLPDELRPITMEVGVLKNADGSAAINWGDNKVIAAVYGPRELHPKHMQHPLRALVQCKYNMAAFSVGDRKRPGPDRRSVEISKVLSEALTHVVFVEEFPKSTIDVYVEILQASAGTRCVGLTAASLALADAGIPMRDLVTSCAAGKVGGEIVLDLSKEEDNYGEADLPVGLVVNTDEVVLMQMDGHLTVDEFDTAMNLIEGAARKIYRMQVDAIKRKYSEVGE